MKRHIHLIAPPNCQTTQEYALDGFTVATRRFAGLLKNLDYRVTLYASEENDAACDELVTVITKEEQGLILGSTPYQHAAMDNCNGLWSLSNGRCIKEISKRKSARDFICVIGGSSQKPIADAHPDLFTVEYSIGYVSSFANYRVYESDVWRHFTHGYQGNASGRHFDATIPMFFPASEYSFNPTPEPFVLYVGRLVPLKGLSTACEAAAAAGVKLKVIGHGDPALVTHGAEYLGPLDSKTRNEYFSKASALLCPTQYLEPFGAVAIEAQLCGTPVISTDFGAFVETVEQGKTGFRCSYLGEFVRGIGKATDLDRAYIHQRAVSKYSIEAVQKQYADYFDRLSLLWEKGWNTL